MKRALLRGAGVAILASVGTGVSVAFRYTYPNVDSWGEVGMYALAGITGAVIVIGIIALVGVAIGLIWGD